MSLVSLVIFIVGIVVLPLIFIRFVNLDSIKKRPSMAAITAAFFVLIGFIAAFFIFSSALSIVMVAFSSLLLLPFIIKLLEPVKYDVEKEEKRRLYYWFNPSNISDILKRHNLLIKFYIFLFFGMALEYTLLFAVLSPSLTDVAFQNQLSIFGPRGDFADLNLFSSIVENNLQIAIISFVFSIFYGAGSILILNYTASIVGVMYGSTFRTIIWGAPVFYTNILLLLPHTILEILAYLLAAVAGGILISGLRRKALEDSIVLFTLSAILIFIAGYVEVTVPFL